MNVIFDTFSGPWACDLNEVTDFILSYDFDSIAGEYKEIYIIVHNGSAIKVPATSANESLYHQWKALKLTPR
ncbi:hypothetical protein [Paraburkholderia tropica]|uniref:hypothetical protein n=1 Tax=Paraburkholderia tropica TaxID=92647 RepID=UPI003D290CA2